MFVDPSNTCGDPGSSSTRGYRIQTSTDGTTFTTVNQGVFYSGNRNRLNDVGALSGGPVNGVRYIKFWILNPQVPNAASGFVRQRSDVRHAIRTTTRTSPPTAGPGRTTGSEAARSWTWSS